MPRAATGNMTDEAREDRIDMSAGGGLNNAAVQASGLTGTEDVGERDLPGTDDLGAAVGRDIGSGLGKTRGTNGPHSLGQITPIGGTRGAGAGAADSDDTPSPAG